MSEALIPFALDSNGVLVEVFDVPRGRQCDCLCPSCRQGVISRQGKQKVWHFAHDYNADAKPIQACDLSFYSCCRLYLIERALAGELHLLYLPALILREQIGNFRRIEKQAVVTPAREIEVAQFQSTGEYDLEAKFGNYKLALHIQYPGRALPAPPESGETGLLAVDISSVKARYMRGICARERILPLLKALFASSIEEAGSITWLHHPREETIRAALRESVLSDYDPMLDLPPKAAEIPHPFASPNNCEKPSVFEPHHDEGSHGKFLCLKCSATWNGKRFVDAACRDCKTHLYSRFQPSK